MSVRKEYEDANLPDYENPDIKERHQAEKLFVEDIEKREFATGKNLEVKLKHFTPGNTAVRIGYEAEKLSLGKMPIWYLQALGSMSPKEAMEFAEAHKDEMTLNELISYDLLMGTYQGDEKCVNRFWELQKAMMSKKTVINEVSQTVVKPNSVMNDILDSIEQNLPEAEVMEKPKKVSRTKKPKSKK